MTTKRKTDLTPAQKLFAIEYAKTDNATEAVRRAFPEIAEKIKPTSSYLRVKGSDLLAKPNVKAEIMNRKAIMEASADLAAQRLQDIITDGREHNALEASKFVIEQIDGKAKQITEVKSQHVQVVYDLSGGQSGEIPEHIKQQLLDQ